MPMTCRKSRPATRWLMVTGGGGGLKIGAWAVAVEV
jgi:hypothetical protein